jgi:hypothetical protein
VTELEADPQRTAQRLSDLDESERNDLFARLQERMPAVWDARRLELEDESVVVVPSVTLDPAVPGSGRGLDAAGLRSAPPGDREDPLGKPSGPPSSRPMTTRRP